MVWDMRTHVVQPDELVQEIDQAVGKRGRSRFLADAAWNQLRRARQNELLSRSAGILRQEDYPGWGSSDMVLAWVRADRRGQSWLTTKPPPPNWRTFLDEE